MVFNYFNYTLKCVDILSFEFFCSDVSEQIHPRPTSARILIHDREGQKLIGIIF